MNLPLDVFLELLNKAKEKQQDDRYFQMWLVQFRNMDKDNYISFQQYKDDLTGKNICTKPTNEMLKEVEEINKMFGGDKNGS